PRREVAFTECVVFTQPARHYAKSSVLSLVDSHAFAAALLHQHFFTRTSRFVFEPYVDSYSSTRTNHEDKNANCCNGGQCWPRPRTGRVGTRRDSGRDERRAVPGANDHPTAPSHPPPRPRPPPPSPRHAIPSP